MLVGLQSCTTLVIRSKLFVRAMSTALGSPWARNAVRRILHNMGILGPYSRLTVHVDHFDPVPHVTKTREELPESCLSVE